MLRKQITYTDYNDVLRTEDFYFNLSKAEIADLELMTPGGLEYTIKKMIQTEDRPGLVTLFKKIILESYGEKSPDGKRFMKNPELSKAFSETEAFVELYMELVTDAKAASAFINAIVPQKQPE